MLKTRAKTAVDNLVAKKIPGVAPQLAKINTRMDETRFKILEEKQKQQEQHKQKQSKDWQKKRQRQKQQEKQKKKKQKQQ